MAPSPALRFSTGWKPMAENGHKRGRSFESGLTFRNKDDDLVLFNEMQNQEKDNFLLHTADDFEDSISKLRYFSDFKLGINIPTRGKSSDLLNLEGDKNDYDWLLTPPDTPLFRSLDDEYPQPVNLASRGRSRSQSITSRPVTDKSNQTSQISSSPSRLSPSPRSSGTLAQMRWRPSSIPQFGAPCAFRSTTPTGRSSTPNKQSIHTPRSSTPKLQRPSTAFGIHSSNYAGRGCSLVKASHGNCSSPNLRGWQRTLPGFTSETPPNLRTSLSDRPMSYTRGSSPASRNVRESSRKLGMKSMSSTSSRSISSLNGQKRNCFSSYSKCSMASYGDDDDEECMHSIGVGIPRSLPVKKDGAPASNKTRSYLRKSSAYSPTNSIPKRSFDSALRLMDQYKTPQNMFRPLFSSVPATTFRPIFSRNSSLTTSSNASSEQGLLSVALDVEGIELEPTELHAGWEKAEDSEAHEEIFLFDKVDEIIEDTNHEVLSRRPSRRDEKFGEILSRKFDLEDIHNPMFYVDVETSKDIIDKNCDIDGHIMTANCSKCSKEFKILDLDENVNLCQECAEEDRLCKTGRALTCAHLTQNATILMDLAVGSAVKGPLNSEVPEFHQAGELMGTDCLPNICSIQLLDEMEAELSNQHLDRKSDINVPRDVSINAPQLSNHFVNPSLKIQIPESTVLLLHRYGSSKWPILQEKTMSVTNVLCFEPSYSIDNINYLQRSIGRDSASATSLVDLGSSRQTETSIQHQLWREGGADNMRNDTDGNPHSESLPDDFPMNCYESGHPKSESEQTVSSSTECLGYESLREIILDTEEHYDSLDQSNFNDMPSSSTRPVIFENLISKHTDCCITITTYDSQNLNDLGNSDLPCSSAAAEIMCNEDCTSSIDADEYPQNNGRNIRNIGGTDIRGCSAMEEDYTMLNCASRNDNLDAATKRSFILTTELQHGSSEIKNYHTECIPSHNPAYTEQSNGHSISQTSENDVSFSTSEPSKAVLEHGNHEYSGIIIELPKGHMSRSLTLEEVKDTILFCSSIIHGLAYQAATIGIEKELNLLTDVQVSDPSMTSLAKPIPGLRESWKVSYKQTPRYHKFKRKRMESQTKSPHKEAENDVSGHEFSGLSIETPVEADTGRPPKLESKCNCTVM